VLTAPSDRRIDAGTRYRSVRRASAIFRIAATALLFCVVQAVHGQGDTAVRIDQRWRPFLGCWVSVSNGIRLANLCLLPTPDSADVEMLAFFGDSVLSRTTLSATGARAERRRDDCAGWDRTQWSLDERRVYMRTEYVCSWGERQVSTSVMSFTGTNAFTRVDGARNAQEHLLRVVRYTAFDDMAGVPIEIISRLSGVDVGAVRAARANSAADVSLADVADAASALDDEVTEAWLSDRGHRYALSRDDVRSLRDVAVSTRVIDAMLGRPFRTLFDVAERPPRVPRLRQGSGRQNTGTAAPVSTWTPFFHGIRSAVAPEQSTGCLTDTSRECPPFGVQTLPMPRP
jgi:hypothetical protein